MKVLLIDIDKSSRHILLEHIRTFANKLEVEERSYHPDVFADLHGWKPKMVILDISGHKDWVQVCAASFTLLPNTCLLLVGDADVFDDERYKAEPVLHMPYMGYVRKPLASADLERIVTKHCCKMPKKKAAVNEAGIVPENNLVQIFQYDILLTHLFKGRASKEEMKNIRALLGVEKDVPRYFRVFAVESKNEESDPLPNNFALFATLQQYIRCKGMVTCSSPIQLTGILASSSPLMLPPGSVEWETLKGWLQSKVRVPQALFVSLSPVFDSLDEVEQAYQCAITGLQKSFFTGYRQVAENDAAIAEKLLYNNAKELIDEFSMLVLTQNKAGLRSFAAGLHKKMKVLDIHYIFGIQRLYIRLLYRLAMGEMLMKITAVQKDILSENIHAMVKRIPTLAELHQCLLDRLEEVFEGAWSAVTNAEVNTMHILEYIRKNYNDPTLSLQSISENVYLSPSHLSAEFKKTMGLPVAKYLNQYRIEQSKYLLDNPANRLESVAQMVGFNDARQFAKVFRRLEGMSPSEYRKGIKHKPAGEWPPAQKEWQGAPGVGA